MKEWQGPALWVHNDKMFTEEDFKNITRLNAGTKKSEATKIGKFGLGFNAVYHLTDVPSILSNKSLIFFDPHFKYLGDAVRSLEPGVRISLDGNIADLEIYKDQFAVFEKIFGAHVNLNPKSPCQQYNGSLFRFPLRNANCARTSAIKPVHYSDSEMRDLLNKVKESLQTLILFTQNVSSLSVYELKDHAKTPTDMKLLFSATKSKDHGIRDMVHHANNQLYGRFVEENHVTSSIDLKVQKDKAPSTQKWIVQSRNSEVDTYNFVKKHPNEGYLPYCSVAVCVNAENENKIVQQNGHFFCFLPLPIENGLPCHVNAAFKLSRDRLSLKLHNEDEKIYHTAENWNDLIAKDVGNAYYSLLLHLINKMGIAGQDFFNLFPSKDELQIQHFTKIVLRSLIDNCFKRNDAVFPYLQDSTNENTTSWMRWGDLCFPGTTIPEPIQASCIKFLNWHTKKFKQQFRCVQLPTVFKALIRKLGFDDQITPKEKSFQQVMQIMSQSVQDTELPQQIRNEIVNFLLAKATLHKTPLIEQPCIPTKPNGRLRRIDELVEEDSPVSGLYDVEDERFPDLTDNDVIKYLKTRGMESADLSWGKILERAKDIQQNKNKQRGKSLLKLISQKVENRDVPKSFTEDDLSCQELRKVKFLPVLKKPKPSFFNNWHGASTKVCSPEEIYPISFSTTLSSSNYICSEKMEKNVMDFLKINCIPRQEDLLRQLDSFLPNFDTTNQEKCTSILKNITIALTQIELSKETQIILAQSKFILADNCKLYSSETVFLKADHKITDKLHSLHNIYNDIEQDVKQFFVDIGVKEKVTGAHYTNALKSLSVEYNNNPLLKHHLQEIYHLVPTLVNSEEKESFIEDLYLPDQQAVLQKASELCYNDVNWLPNDADVHYLNAEVSLKHAQDLKIKSRRSDYVLRGKHIDDTPWIPQSHITKFGQHESLTTRIKSLIKNYSDPFDVLKEMIQNADDAEASEIEFILDKRHHGTEKTISEKWENLQGPGLLIINNGQFTKDDLEGIQNLGVGSRKDDALKTGKYGVGFNTVYSLTDCPILLTRVDGSEDRMCMFDPHLKYSEGSYDRKPGWAIKDPRKFLEPYDDIKNAFLFYEKELETKTILRLPFRNEKMAAESKISTESVSIHKVEKKLKDFLKHGDEFLLFLNNIKTIKIRIINGEGQKDDLFRVQTELYDTLQNKVDSFKISAKNYADRFGDIFDMMDSDMQIHRKHCIRNYKGDKVQYASHWDVFEQVGFSNFKVIPDPVKEILENRTHHLVPKGGIAKLSFKNGCIKCENEKFVKNHYTTLNSLFCTLPLNLKTGISGIINGNYFLDSENRRSLYNGTGTHKQWNQTILNHCVLPCFISHLEYVKNLIEGKYTLLKEVNEDNTACVLKRIEVSRFLNLFPTTAESTDEYFKTFTQSFYMKIQDDRTRLLPVHRPGDVRFWSPGEFLLYKGNDVTANLLKVMKLANLKVDILPDKIKKNFSETGRQQDLLTFATPPVVREILKKEKGLIILRTDGVSLKNKTSLKAVENVNTLLDFCLKKDETNEKQLKEVSSDSSTPSEKPPMININISGLPLCLLQDLTLKYFSSECPVFLTKFSTLFEEKKSLFMHSFSHHTLSQKHIDQSCFKEYDLHQFKEMLRNSSYNEHLKSSMIKEENHKLKAWIASCWSLIKSRYDNEKHKHDEEKRKQKEEKKKQNEERRKRNEEPIVEEASEQEKTGKGNILEKQLEIIEDVRLLLVKRRKDEFLLPVQIQKKILAQSGNSSNDKKVYDFVTKICQGYELVKYYTYWPNGSTPVYPQSLLQKMFAKVDNFNEVVASLEYALSLEPTRQLPVDETNDFLQRLSMMMNDGDKKASGKSKTTLRSLPLFQHHNGKLVEASGKVCILSQDVPKSALNIIEKHRRITILHNVPSLEKLHTSLGFEIINTEKFYTSYVIPCLVNFDDKQVQEYLYLVFDLMKRRKHMLTKLEDISFIRTNDLDRARKSCCQLFHPDNELFQLMEPESSFPNQGMYSMYKTECNFDRQHWMDFFLSLGMCQGIKSGDHFLKYARNLEAESNHEKVKKVSKMLCEILLTNSLSKDQNVKKWSMDSQFLHQLKSVRFITPHAGNCDFENLFKSQNSLTDRISFNECVTSNCFELVWTSKLVLPPYAVNLGNQQMPAEMMKSLGVSDKNNLSMAAVKQNLTTLVRSEEYLETTCSSSCMSVKKEYQAFYSKALENVYEFCSKHPNELESLKDLSFILVNNSTALEQPRRCIQAGFGTILPFLSTIHSVFGKYFSVFQTLGCYEQPNFLHYVDVLMQIKQNEDLEKKGFLDENHAYCATFAVTKLSGTLTSVEMVPSTCNQDLYLPTFKFSDAQMRMVMAKDCLILDDTSLEERLKLFDQPILRSSRVKGLTVEKEINDKLLKYLPDSMKPKTFRSSVEEVLCKSCVPVQVDKRHVSRKLKQRMKHAQFINGFKRLLNHEEVEDEKINHQKILMSVKISVMENLKTELKFDGVKIKDSEITKDVFTDLSGEQLIIYFNEQCNSEEGIPASISNALLQLFRDPLKTSTTITCFPSLLTMPPDKIDGFLNSQNILNSGSHSEYRNAGKPPPLGRPIPQEHHGILDFDSFEFEVGQYVAFDENDEGEDYVFTKIANLNEDGTVKIQLVDDEDVDVDEAEGFKDVPKSTLYKYEKKYSKPVKKQPQEEEIQDEQSQEVVTMETGGARRRSRGEKSEEREETRSYEEICGEIKKTITDLKSKDEEEQRRVLRRLYLKWHPDKHANKALANEVFKFLMNEKKQLNSDFSDHFAKWNEQASNSRSSRQSYEENYEDFFNQHSGFRDGAHSSRDGQRRQSSSFYDNVPPKFTSEDPQPAKARRWFRQAQYDLNQVLEMKKCPEWICYVSHQVAEKALKAAIFSKDYKQTLLDERNLRSLVRNFQHADDELKKDVEELQSLIIDENKPRYPCRRSQKIPHDSYNQQTADQALILAQRIVENIVRNFEVE